MFVVDNGTGSIFSAALDGSGIRTIETGLYFPTGIAYYQEVSTVPEPSSLAIAETLYRRSAGRSVDSSPPQALLERIVAAKSAPGTVRTERESH